MSLMPCARCDQPFYASCHDGSCTVGTTLCPLCEYADDPGDEMPSSARIVCGHGEGASRAPKQAPGAAPGREATC